MHHENKSYARFVRASCFIFFFFASVYYFLNIVSYFFSLLAFVFFRRAVAASPGPTAAPFLTTAGGEAAPRVGTSHGEISYGPIGRDATHDNNQCAYNNIVSSSFERNKRSYAIDCTIVLFWTYARDNESKKQTIRDNTIVVKVRYPVIKT